MTTLTEYLDSQGNSKSYPSDDQIKTFHAFGFLPQAVSSCVPYAHLLANVARNTKTVKYAAVTVTGSEARSRKSTSTESNIALVVWLIINQLASPSHALPSPVGVCCWGRR